MRKNTIGISIIIVAFLMLTGCGTVNVPESTTKTDVPAATTETSNSNERKIIDIDGLPSSVMAGEEVYIRVQILDANNQTQWYETGFEFYSESEDLVFENNMMRLPVNFLTGDIHNVKIAFEDIEEEIILSVANLLSRTIDENGTVTNPSSYDAVINKVRSLPSNYVPSDLVTVEVPTCLPNPEIRQLRRVASEALSEMFKAGLNDDVELVARSGYRSYATQVALYNGYVSKYGQEYADKYSARPGTSEHQTGLAMDITAESVNLQLDDDFGKTKEGQWLAQNAYRFGFIIRYPEGMENITGYFYEPWHVRYLGVNLATKVFNSGLTLEEYFLSLENN
jgi:D-alanyl-D-alanine carboxypeptidase